MSDRQLSGAQIAQRKSASAQAALLLELKANPRGGKHGRPAKQIDLAKVGKLVAAGASVSQVAQIMGVGRGTAQRAVARVKAGGAV